MDSSIRHKNSGEVLHYSPAGPVIAAFHKSNAFFRGLMGPVGSSKTSACVMEGFTRSCEQAPFGGIRRVRGAATRSTYPELKSTTIKTFAEWLPFMKIRWDVPITARGRLALKDGTILDLEVMFIALDRPEETGKLRSLELTWAWANEGSEQAKEVIEMLTQRVGRYPPMKYGGPTWSGVFTDTNAPDTDHFYYKLAEVEKPKGYEFF
ncbi:MAG: TerL, partial [Burkholderiales bacterium]